MAGGIGTKGAPDRLSSDSPAPSLLQALMPEQHCNYSHDGDTTIWQLGYRCRRTSGGSETGQGPRGGERRQRAAPKGGRAAHPVPRRPRPRRVLGRRCPAGGSRAPRSAASRPPPPSGPAPCPAPPGLALSPRAAPEVDRAAPELSGACRVPAAEYSAGTIPAAGCPLPAASGPCGSPHHTRPELSPPAAVSPQHRQDTAQPLSVGRLEPARLLSGIYRGCERRRLPA